MDDTGIKNKTLHLPTWDPEPEPGSWREQLPLTLLHTVLGLVSDHSVVPSSLPHQNGDSEGTDGSRWSERSAPPDIRTWQQESFCWGSGHLGRLTFEPFEYVTMSICVFLSMSLLASLPHIHHPSTIPTYPLQGELSIPTSTEWEARYRRHLKTACIIVAQRDPLSKN